MKFSGYWMDSGSSDGKPMAPNGLHTGEIIDAKEQRMDFMKSERNRDGACVVVTVAVARFQSIESIVPANYRGRIESLSRAAGVPLPAGDADWDVGALLGRTVTIETLQVRSKKGRDYVRVEKWLPSPASTGDSPQKAPARSQSAKAHREFTATSQAADDIPF